MKFEVTGFQYFFKISLVFIANLVLNVIKIIVDVIHAVVRIFVKTECLKKIVIKILVQMKSSAGHSVILFSSILK